MVINIPSESEASEATVISGCPISEEVEIQSGEVTNRSSHQRLNQWQEHERNKAYKMVMLLFQLLGHMLSQTQFKEYQLLQDHNKQLWHLTES